MKQGKEFPASSTCSIVSCCLVCSGLHARYTDAFNGSYNSLLDMNNVCWYVLVRQLPHCCADLWLLIWTRQDREGLSVSSATMVIKISRVHSPVVKAADRRSAGPWFTSGRRSWFTFVTWSDELTNHTAQRNNIMSPITTITRKSVENKRPTDQH